MDFSEDHLRLVVDTIPTLAWSACPSGSAEYFNQRWLDYTGLSADEARGWGWTVAVHADDSKRLLDYWRSLLKSSEPGEIEGRIRRSDGVFHWFLVHLRPHRDSDGRIVRWYAMHAEIDDWKRADESLQAAMSERARLSGVRAEIAKALASKDTLKGILQNCSETLVRHLDASFVRIWTLKNGGSELELQASAGIYTRRDGRYSRIRIGDIKIGLIAKERQAHLTNDVQNDPRIRDQNWARAEKIQSFAGYPLVVEDRVVGVIGMFSRHMLSDSTLETLAFIADGIAQSIERKRAEDALDSSERNLSLIINTIPTTAWTTRPDGCCDFLNQRWLDYASMTAEQAAGWGWAAAIHPDDRQGLVEYWQSALASGVPVETEARMRRYDGAYRWFLFRANPVRDESGKIVKWYGTNIDIEDRKRGEAQLEQAYLRLAEAQRLSKTGSFITDLVADEHNWSEETFRIFEFDPATKVTVQRIREIIHPEDLSSFNAMIARAMTGADVDFVFRIATSRGGVKHIRGMARIIEQVAGRPLFIGALQDITESKIAEAALNKARSELGDVARVTTLNALTASIAHEINQPLASLITNASICLRRLNADPPNVDGARETVQRTIRDGNRASDVITRLRVLFSKKEFTLEALDLNEATLEVIALSLSDLQRNRVILRSELAENLPPVIGDRVQLQQVILNLLRNASDAMLAIEDRPRHLLIITQREGDDRVCLSVQDAGCGVNPEDFERLFEAFYTSKSGGMGIGLSVSRSIIEKHQGRLWAEPNDGPGITFSFSIPCGPG